jgi:hypothetical protein
MKGVELYGRVRYAVQIEGLSRREAARQFGIDPRTVAKMPAFSVPPGYRRSRPPARPKLDPFTGISTGSWRRMKDDRRSSGIPRSGSSNSPLPSAASANTPGSIFATAMLDHGAAQLGAQLPGGVVRSGDHGVVLAGYAL